MQNGKKPAKYCDALNRDIFLWHLRAVRSLVPRPVDILLDANKAAARFQIIANGQGDCRLIVGANAVQYHVALCQKVSRQARTLRNEIRTWPARPWQWLCCGSDQRSVKMPCRDCPKQDAICIVDVALERGGL